MCPPKAPKAPPTPEQRPLRYLLSRAQAREMGKDMSGNNPNAYAAPILNPNWSITNGDQSLINNPNNGGLGT